MNITHSDPSIQVKAIVLFSGGLDSMLATRVLQLQNIEVIGLNFVTPFHDATDDARKGAELLGIELVVHRTGDDYIRLISQPKWGYGKAVNPCIDCRIEMCRVAKRLMEERGAGFVATGEIAGQRPNSQKQHQLNLIARESGLDGYLVRPLSAGILAETKAEENGLVDRSQLFRYTGRGRGRLIALAHRLGIKRIPQPSTGCFLCETSYAPRLLDLFKHESNPTDWDAEVLNAGRQIRVSPTVKVVLGRNARHCDKLDELFDHPASRGTLFLIPESFLGPSAMIIGPHRSLETTEELQEMLRIGGALILRYTNPEKYDPETATVLMRHGSTEEVHRIFVDPQVDELRVIGGKHRNG